MQKVFVVCTERLWSLCFRSCHCPWVEWRRSCGSLQEHCQWGVQWDQGNHTALIACIFSPCVLACTDRFHFSVEKHLHHCFSHRFLSLITKIHPLVTWIVSSTLLTCRWAYKQLGIKQIACTDWDFQHPTFAIQHVLNTNNDNLTSIENNRNGRH